MIPSFKFAALFALFASFCFAQNAVPAGKPAAPAAANSSSGPAVTPGAATDARPTPSGADSASATTGSSKPYVVGALDVLDIQVWNDPKLSGFFSVRPDGFLAMKLVGDIKADGLTVPELTQLIKTKLSALMNDPEVNIQVSKMNSKRYFVFGEVNRPGEFQLLGDTTILDAFANCGGFTGFANTKKIYVLRNNKRLEFNYKDVSKGKHMEQNIQLENGDRIFVP